MSDDYFDDPEGRQARDEDIRRFQEAGSRFRLRSVPGIIAGFLAAITVLGLILLWPTGENRPSLSEIGIVGEVYEAVVVAVDVRGCQGDDDPAALQCQDVVFQLTQGPDAGEMTTLESVIAETSPFFAIGDKVVLAYQPDAQPGFTYSYFDRQRRGVLVWLVAAFGLAVVALARFRGVAALLGLAASLLIVLGFVVPAILDGRDPMLVAIVGASAIAYMALYAAHGITRMTTVALLGTLAALVATILLSWIAVGAAQFTGLTEEVTFVVTLTGSVNLQGLLLAGIVLGSLGAIDDVTVTQASAVWELRAANPSMHRGRLFRSGMKVGRDHIASTVNTLFLAYAGASMPLLLFFVLSHQSLGTFLNSEVVAVEAVRTLVGSIGLVAAVPLTTWLASVMVGDDAGGGGGHSH